MFSGKIPVRVDEDGYVFIDRDGKYFSNILNFLRNGSLEPPRDRSACYDLYKEAEFYQLRSMTDLLAEQLESDCVVANSLKYIANKGVCFNLSIYPSIYVSIYQPIWIYLPLYSLL